MRKMLVLLAFFVMSISSVFAEEPQGDDWLVLSKSNIRELHLYLIQEANTKQCFIFAFTQSFGDGSGYSALVQAKCGAESQKVDAWEILSKGEAPYPIMLVREPRALQCFAVTTRSRNGPVSIVSANCPNPK